MHLKHLLWKRLKINASGWKLCRNWIKLVNSIKKLKNSHIWRYYQPDGLKAEYHSTQKWLKRKEQQGISTGNRVYQQIFYIASSIIPACSSKSYSRILLPTTCIPKGNPFAVFPAGITITGFPVRENGVVYPMFATE